jgi:hypothetical protein
MLMLSWFSQLSHWLLMRKHAAAPTSDNEGNLARTLLQSANARGGSSPVEARALRNAALAYLSVIR